MRLSSIMKSDHGHGHKKYVVPDYKIYKVENHPELMQVKNLLAQEGLSDPWLRNEAWRFDRKVFLTHSERVKLVFFRGFKLGLALAVATVIGETVYDKLISGGNGHGHDGESSHH